MLQINSTNKLIILNMNKDLIYEKLYCFFSIEGLNDLKTSFELILDMGL